MTREWKLIHQLKNQFHTERRTLCEQFNFQLSIWQEAMEGMKKNSEESSANFAGRSETSVCTVCQFSWLFSCLKSTLRTKCFSFHLTSTTAIWIWKGHRFECESPSVYLPMWWNVRFWKYIIARFQINGYFSQCESSDKYDTENKLKLAQTCVHLCAHCLRQVSGQWGATDRDGLSFSWGQGRWHFIVLVNASVLNDMDILTLPDLSVLLHGQDVWDILISASQCAFATNKTLPEFQNISEFTDRKGPGDTFSDTDQFMLFPLLICKKHPRTITPDLLQSAANVFPTTNN